MVARIPLIVNPDAAQIQELPAGDTIDFPVVTLTADGNIADKAPVILTSAGKAKAIETVNGSPVSFSGTASTWEADSGTEAVKRLHDACWFSGGVAGKQSDVVVAAWQIKSSTSSLDQRLHLTVGKLSGTTITWGSRKNQNEITDNVAVASNGYFRGVLMYTLGSAVRVRQFYVPTGGMGEPGTSIVKGNEVTVTANSGEGSLCYLGEDDSRSWFVVAYKQTSGTGNESYMKIIRHEGDSSNLTLGSQYKVEGATTNSHTTTHLIPISHDKFIVQVGQQSSNTTMNVCTRSGYGIRVGPAYTSQQLGSATDPVYLHDDHNNGSAYDPINEKFIIWHSKGNGQEGVVRVYDIVGNSINFRFESIFVADDVEHTNATMYPTVEVTDKGQIVVTFNLDSNNHGKRVVGSYNHDKTQIWWTNESAIFTGSSAPTWSSEDTRYVQQVKAGNSGKIINLFSNGDGSSYNTPGKAVVFQTATTTLTADNFLGFSSAAYSNNDAARIKVVGNTLTTSGLTIGEKYYVKDDGTLGTSEVFYNTNGHGKSFNVGAGKAIAANKLLITPV
tara:strand:- start:27 stop:1703 length:1677 start_codon:yes stop_codon:yes gene_type:complete